MCGQRWCSGWSLSLTVPEEGPILQAKGPAQSQRKPSQAPDPWEAPKAPECLAVGRAAQNMDWKVLEINSQVEELGRKTWVSSQGFPILKEQGEIQALDFPIVRERRTQPSLQGNPNLRGEVEATPGPLGVPSLGYGRRSLGLILWEPPSEQGRVKHRLCPRKCFLWEWQVRPLRRNQTKPTRVWASDPGLQELG